MRSPSGSTDTPGVSRRTSECSWSSLSRRSSRPIARYHAREGGIMQWRKRRDWRGLLAIVPLAAVVTLALQAPTSTSAATQGSTGPALYTWGANRGNFNFTQFPSPTTLPGGVAPKSVENGSATAGGDAFVIGADGGIYAWGSNYCGELGNGNKDTVHMPVAIPLPGGEKATQVSGGYCFTMALGANGHIYTWGKNDKGALGDGTTTDHLTP